MATAPFSSDSFAYLAEAPSGRPLRGTIESSTAEDAGTLLRSLGLRVLEIRAARPAKLRALRGEEFIAFNQQLARLTEAGLPIEQGLRLIAKDVRSGRLAATINNVAGEMERGTSLGDAFNKFRAQFPPLYGRLVDAGVRANNLPAMLLNLGRHVQLVQRMRATLWGALSYPVIVGIAMIFLISFLGIFVLPKFELIFRDFGTQLPAITQIVLTIAQHMPQILLTIGSVTAGILILWAILRTAGLGGWVNDLVLLHIPLLGPVLRRNLIARWCDAMATAVEAGLDLPAAIELCSAAIDSPRLRQDGAVIMECLRAGQSVGNIQLRLLPATVPAILDLGAAGKDLPTALETVSQMFQQQAELRLITIPAILTPVLFIFIGLVIGFVVLAMFAPIISLIQTVSSPKK